MRDLDSIGTRWLGVGLASILAVVTVGLALTGRIGLYINPESSWFAVGMSFVLLAGAVMSFALPLGAESDHGHDHGPSASSGTGGEHGPSASLGTGVDHGPSTSSGTGVEHGPSTSSGTGVEHGAETTRHPAARAATLVGGVAASAIVLVTLVLPPASLSTELAMARDVGAPPLFGGSDVVSLATTGDTASFGVGEWATVMATATNPDAFDGDPVTLTGFITPGESGDFSLTRLVITHCVIDAQPATVPVVAVSAAEPGTGQWVTVTGTVRSTSDGRLVVDAATVERIDEPQDPYEY